MAFQMLAAAQLTGHNFLYLPLADKACDKKDHNFIQFQEQNIHLRERPKRCVTSDSPNWCLSRNGLFARFLRRYEKKILTYD